LTPIPLSLPVRPSEAATLAGLVFQQMEGRTLNDEARARIGARLGPLGLTTIRPYIGSLVRDTVHQVFYLAVDGAAEQPPVPLLLHLASASAPASALFPKALLLGRMRPDGGREVVVNAIPFGPANSENIRVVAETLDRTFLPRPQGTQPAIVAGGGTAPESSLPEAFEAFRQILRNTGTNWAGIAAPYETALWAAIRAGWREGFALETERMVVEGDVESAKAAIRERAGCTRFIVDTSRMAGGESLGSFEELYPDEERSWLFGAFARPIEIGDDVYAFAENEIAGLALKFDRSLKAAEELYDFVRQTRAASGLGRAFEFELSFVAAGAPVAPRELVFCLQWLKSRGRPAYSVSPSQDPLAVAGVAAIARFFNATPSVELGRDTAPETVEAVAAATPGRVICRLTGAYDAASIAALAARLRA
jgi:hypothetical protein